MRRQPQAAAGQHGRSLAVHCAGFGLLFGGLVLVQLHSVHLVCGACLRVRSAYAVAGATAASRGCQSGAGSGRPARIGAQRHGPARIGTPGPDRGAAAWPGPDRDAGAWPGPDRGAAARPGSRRSGMARPGSGRPARIGAQRHGPDRDAGAWPGPDQDARPGSGRLASVPIRWSLAASGQLWPGAGRRS